MKRKPMYRTAAEERLILAAIAEQKQMIYLNRHMDMQKASDDWDYLYKEYRAAVRAVVRERKEGEHGR